MSQAQMTWKEFKEAVDKKLAENNISESVPIWYIDVSYPEKDDFERENLLVKFDEFQGVSI